MQHIVVCLYACGCCMGSGVYYMVLHRIGVVMGVILCICLEWVLMYCMACSGIV